MMRHSCYVVERGGHTAHHDRERERTSGRSSYELFMKMAAKTKLYDAVWSKLAT